MKGIDINNPDLKHAETQGDSTSNQNSLPNPTRLGLLLVLGSIIQTAEANDNGIKVQVDCSKVVGIATDSFYKNKYYYYRDGDNFLLADRDEIDRICASTPPNPWDCNNLTTKIDMGRFAATGSYETSYTYVDNSDPSKPSEQVKLEAKNAGCLDIFPPDCYNPYKATRSPNANCPSEIIFYSPTEEISEEDIPDFMKR